MHSRQWHCWVLIVFFMIIGHDALMASDAHAISTQGRQAHEASISGHHGAQHHEPLAIVSTDSEDAAGECSVSQQASLWTSSGLNRDPARLADSTHTISGPLTEPERLFSSREIGPPERLLLLFQILRI